MRFSIVGLAMALLLPVQAQALSCMKPSIVRTFQEVHAAADSYLVVEGRLTLDVRDLPKTNLGGPSPAAMTHVPAHLTGKSMTRGGFDVPFEKDITLDVACFGPWCGGAANGMEVLAFVKREGGRYSLAVDPCGGHVFANKKALRRQVLGCFRAGGC